MSTYCNERDNPPYDRISTLPDDIRLHILALLPRVDAIRTGALSTQWRELWKLRFSYETLLNFRKTFAGVGRQAQFVDEINRCLQSYQDKKIESFSLSFNPVGGHNDAIKEWIQRSISRGVQEFDLDFSQGLASGHLDGKLVGYVRKPMLTEALFKDSMLTRLHLWYCILHRTFKFKFFGHLESLDLHGINITDVMVQRAIANCKLLRRLTLSQCFKLEHIIVSGPELKLKLLVVAHCWGLSSLEISAPMLVSIELKGKFPAQFALTDISSLMHVSLSPLEDELYTTLRNWMIPIIALNQVKSLLLGGNAIQRMVEHEPFLPALLSHVQILRLSINTEVQFDVVNIYKLLKKYQFPQLQLLLVQLPAALDDLTAENLPDAPEADLFNIRFERLKEIHMHNFHVSPIHINLSNYFLERAVALDEITLALPSSYIVHEIDSSSGTMINGLMQQLRASTTTQIDVVYLTGSGGFASFAPT